MGNLLAGYRYLTSGSKNLVGVGLVEADVDASDSLAFGHGHGELRYGSFTYGSWTTH
jgi:hypothetical protein